VTKSGRSESLKIGGVPVVIRGCLPPAAFELLARARGVDLSRNGSNSDRDRIGIGQRSGTGMSVSLAG
jgi:hypothetical protein